MKNKTNIGLLTKVGSYESPPRTPSLTITNILFFNMLS